MNVHTQPGPNQPKRSKWQAESGQAIVVMALMMIGLLGMLGLAIDGGGLYFMWRDVRNATDAAVLAASYAKCTGGDIVTAGLNAAANNGFDNNGASNTVQVNNPPTSGDASGDDDFVEVIINANRPSYFIHLVYKGPLEVTNYAVGYCVPAFDPSKVPGLWAGGTCNNTVNWTGSDVRIEGGMYGNKEVYISQGDVYGDVEYVNLVGRTDGQVNWHPWPVQIPAPKPDPMNLNIGLYAPGGEVSTTIQDLDPTAYTYIRSGSPDYNHGTWSPSRLTLRGLYYVEGDVSLGTVGGANQNLWDQTVGATVVATGAIDLGGHNGHFAEFYEGVMETTASGIEYPGILLFSAMNNPCSISNTDAISMSGNGFVTHGILYAPRGNTNFSGSDLVMHGTVIADSINYSGSKGWMIYDPSILPPRPPRINVAE